MLNHQRRMLASLSGKGALCLLAAAAAGLALAQTASAQTPPPPGADDVVVFASASGVDLGPILLNGSSVTTFDLYVDVGDAASTPRDACQECNSCEGSCDACNFCDEEFGSDPAYGAPCNAAPSGGNGDEVCGLDVQIALAGDASIDSFQGNNNLCGESARFASYPTFFGEVSERSLRFNLLCGLDPLPAGIHRLGTLGVEVGEIGTNDVASVTVSGEIAVGANRQERGVRLKLIATPEPGAALGLLAGVGALVALGGTRLRRAAGPRRSNRLSERD